ncbi:MAG: hypothetical protein M0C28_23375 [Candidatus Moduliflexus flocculans]|nr:hypothetical protein [Candidatus Moduliflexus flocculans]
MNQAPHQLDLLVLVHGARGRGLGLLGQPQPSLHRGRGHGRRRRSASPRRGPGLHPGVELPEARASTPRSTSTGRTGPPRRADRRRGHVHRRA